MSGIRPEPIRPGARGGRSEFSWDNVKADKDREYYLGHSVKALAGRWQKGKDVYWYTREKEGGGSTLQDEIKAVKLREEEAMLEVGSMISFPEPRSSSHALLELLAMRSHVIGGGHKEGGES